MVEAAAAELARAQAMAAFEVTRSAGVPERAEMKTVTEQDAAMQEAFASISAFLEDRAILSVPAWLGPPHQAEIPDYLLPLWGLYSDNDMSIVDPLGDQAIPNGGAPMAFGLTRFSPPPSPKAGFFPRSAVYDIRPQISHEAFPGHQTQLAMSQRNPRAARRKFLDSVSNEGIGTYLEEMLLHHGLFDDNPHTRADIWAYCRLRMLRIACDLKLGCGLWSTQEAADWLEVGVPMDAETALEDAEMYLAAPGLGLSYGVGKAQIVRFLAAAQRLPGFALRTFHDRLWLDGNVPLELQMYEALPEMEPPPAIRRLLQAGTAKL